MKNIKGYQLTKVLTATLERLFKSYNTFDSDKIEIELKQWNQDTMGVNYRTTSDGVFVKIVVPSIDDTATYSQEQVNHLIALVFHEVGHVLFTNTNDWDDSVARFKEDYPDHSKFFFNLINGLEDVRQEQLLIERTSKNAKPLLVKLLNDMIKKGNGLPETNDFLNIPFTLAVEGRRLNGYKVDYDFDWSACPWKEEIDCSLDALRSAKSTLDVTNIALTLWYSLEKYLAKGQLPDQPQEEGAEQSEEESQEDGQDDSQESEGDSQDDSQGSDSESGEESGEESEGDSEGDSQGDSQPSNDDNVADDNSYSDSGRTVEPSANDDLPRLDDQVFRSHSMVVGSEYSLKPRLQKVAFNDRGRWLR
jgi:hypothetical protein